MRITSNSDSNHGTMRAERGTENWECASLEVGSVMKRRVMGTLILMARLIGLGLIVLGVLSLPQTRFLTGNIAGKIGIVAALALGFVGILWLIAVQVFLYFFDQFLSRN